MKNVRRIVQFVAVLALLFALGHAAKAAGAEVVRIAYSSPTTNQIVAWAAADQGFLERHGIRGEVKLVAPATTLLQSMLSNEIQFGALTADAVIYSVLGGSDIRMIAVSVFRSEFAAYVSKGIERPEDLKGKKFGISRFGSATHSAALVVLEQFGLKPKDDVAILQMGSLGNIVQALNAGNIQAGILAPPATFQADALGLRPIFDFIDKDISEQFVSIAVRKSYAAPRQEIMLGFMRAYYDAFRFVKDPGNREPLTALIRKYLKMEDPKTLNLMVEQMAKLFQTSRTIRNNMDGIRTAMRRVALTNPEVSKRQPGDFVDDSFYEALEKTGYFKP